MKKKTTVEKRYVCWRTFSFIQSAASEQTVYFLTVGFTQIYFMDWLDNCIDFNPLSYYKKFPNDILRHWTPDKTISELFWESCAFHGSLYKSSTMATIHNTEWFNEFEMNMFTEYPNSILCTSELL